MASSYYDLGMVTLRSASAADLPFVVALEKEYAALGFVGTDGEEIHAVRLTSRDARYLVVEENRLAVGYVILCGLDSSSRCIELKRVVVSRPGQGLGRQALGLTLEMAFTELAAHRLWLDVYTDSERARRTYRALGFVEEGTMRECIWQGGRFRSMVLLAMLEEEFRGK